MFSTSILGDGWIKKIENPGCTSHLGPGTCEAGFLSAGLRSRRTGNRNELRAFASD